MGVSRSLTRTLWLIPTFWRGVRLDQKALQALLTLSSTNISSVFGGETVHPVIRISFSFCTLASPMVKFSGALLSVVIQERVSLSPQSELMQALGMF